MLKYIFALSIFLIYGSLFGQSSLLSSGGNTSGSSGSVSYSFGQLVVIPSSNGNLSIAPGVQQPYEITEIVGTEEVLHFPVKVYPNPAIESVWIEINDEHFTQGDLNLSIISADQKILYNSNIMNSKEDINMSSIKPGIYFFIIKNITGQSRTFKIVKI